MRCIELTKGYVAIISDADFRRVNRYSWHVHVSKGSKKKPGQPYARTQINGRKVYLHRFVMMDEIVRCCIEGCTEREAAWHVDHKNHQTLDCRRENLRVCLHIENQLNRRNVRRAA